MHRSALSLVFMHMQTWGGMAASVGGTWVWGGWGRGVWGVEGVDPPRQMGDPKERAGGAVGAGRALAEAEVCVFQGSLP